MDSAAAKQAATGLLEMVQIFATARFGEQAAFDTAERFLIEAPLSRLIEKYGSLAERYSGLIDPVLVLSGVALYTIRLGALAQEQALKEAPKAPSQENGSAPSAEARNPSGNGAEPPIAGNPSAMGFFPELGAGLSL